MKPEVLVGDLALARDGLRHAGLETRREGHAGEGEPLKEDRARPVGHEEAADLLGGMGGPPAHNTYIVTGRGREVPGRRHRAREAGNRRFLPGLGIDFLEVEDAVEIGSYARRRGGPENRGEDRREAREVGRVTLRRQALPVGHLAFAGQAIEQLPVQGVHPQPDDRMRLRGRARHAGGDIGVLHRGSRTRRLGALRLRGFAAAREERGAEEQRRENELEAASSKHRPPS